MNQEVPKNILHLVENSYDRQTLENLQDYAEYQNLVHPGYKEIGFFTEHKFKRATKFLYSPEVLEALQDFS
jgi:hypothetical protein